jgi:hypothetical protein
LPRLSPAMEWNTDATDNTPSVALMRTGAVPPLALAGVPPSGAMKERLSGRLP